jgi:hypothetical protein
MLKETIRCKSCGKVKSRIEIATHKPTGYSRGVCKKCQIENVRTTLSQYVPKKLKYRLSKKGYCEMCGFKGYRCQFDVNHKDMNHKNNELDNLETLCANCHRLVTFITQRGQEK